MKHYGQETPRQGTGDATGLTKQILNSDYKRQVSGTATRMPNDGTFKP